MHHGGKIIFGLVVFVTLVTFPIWFTGATGNTGYVPEPKLPAGGGRCVESREYMKAWHMDLLNQWRDLVVRNGQRVYISKTYGTEHPMSLSDMTVQSCMSCHNDKAAFCDSCHTYVGAEPYCWECHNIPTPGMAQLQPLTAKPPLPAAPATDEPAPTPATDEGVTP